MISDQSKKLVTNKFIGHVTSQDMPCIYATCGIPGAGKSHFVDRMLETGQFPSNAYILNPDRLMVVLPEYKNNPDHQQAYEALELPSRDLAYSLADTVIERRGHIVKDMGGANPLSLALIQKAKAQGYRIYMYHIECPLEEAFRRIEMRDFQISQGEVRERLAQLELLLSDYRAIADSFMIYDNADTRQPFKKLAA